VFLHGYGDYSGRYNYFFKNIPAHGMSVYTLDQAGFGESEGEKRGIYTSIDDMFSLL
jgi:alpha-beta hydrolase superfamily lysophospholipase